MPFTPRSASRDRKSFRLRDDQQPEMGYPNTRVDVQPAEDQGPRGRHGPGDPTDGFDALARPPTPQASRRKKRGAIHVPASTLPVPRTGKD